MNLTISPINNRNYNLSFKANPTQELANIAKKESGLFSPMEKQYDKFTDWLAKNFTSKFAESKPIEYLGDKFKNSKKLFQHCLTVGSVITSGLYMQRTYTNKKLDKDRRNTLVVNQGLTLAVSTAGAYLLDKSLNGWWDKVTAKFAGHLLGDDKFQEDYLKIKEDIIKENKTIKENLKKGQKAELKEIPFVTDIVKKRDAYKRLGTDEAKSLITKVRGMGPMKSMIVFGFVYRYFVPVAVTKPANKLCEMYLEHKKSKKAEKA